MSRYDASVRRFATSAPQATEETFFYLFEGVVKFIVSAQINVVRPCLAHAPRRNRATRAKYGARWRTVPCVLILGGRGGLPAGIPFPCLCLATLAIRPVPIGVRRVHIKLS